MRAMRESEENYFGHRRFGIAALIGNWPAYAFFAPPLFSPPSCLARAKSKNRPKTGGFGLHKSVFFRFHACNARERGIEISPLAALGRNDKVFDLSSRAEPRDLMKIVFEISPLARLGNLRSSPCRDRQVSPLRCLGFPQKAGAFRGPDLEGRAQLVPRSKNARNSANAPAAFFGHRKRASAERSEADEVYTNWGYPVVRAVLSVG